MVKTKTRSVALKEETIKNLDTIAHLKIKQAISDKSFSIDILVKNKRGISYNKEILYLSEFYLKCLQRYNLMTRKQREKSEIGKVFKILKKINGIA